MGLFGPPNVARLDAAGKIDGLVRAAAYKKDPAVREAARASLESYLDKIIERLQSRKLVQLETSREALVLIGAPARDRLIFVLREGHLHRRQDAAFVLGKMGDPVAVKPLCLAMHNSDPLLRMLCVEALGRIGDSAAIDTLRRAIGDPDRKVSSAARKSLKKVDAGDRLPVNGQAPGLTAKVTP